MFSYLLKRVLNMLPLLLGITVMSFFVIQLAPGGPVTLGAAMDPRVSAEAQARMLEAYGLNKPLYVQYWDWLARLAHLDFGTSFSPDGRPVFEKIVERMPVTLSLNVLELLIVLMISVPLGVASARRQNSVFDRSVTVLLFMGFAAPSFWIGLLGMVFFSVQLGWFPVSGLRSFGAEDWGFWPQTADMLWHLALPLAVATVGSVAGMSRYMRSSMLEVIRQDYITAARAKGLSDRAVMYKHALRNALLPLVTILGLSIPGLIGGSVIFESLFSIPGMGQLFYDAVMMRDYPVIMGILTIGAVLTLLGNLLADVGYALVDPRLRRGNET